MCGRFTITTSLSGLASLFECENNEVAPNRYNIAPTQPIPVIFQDFSMRRLQLMRWGFVPAWAQDLKRFSLIINARSESVTTKPSFKSAIRHRRCIIPASGFYEWRRDGTRKIPYYIKPREGVGVGYAGIYETYAAANGSEIDTVCFITTAASVDIAQIHHRMPVLIAPEKAETWLDCAHYKADEMASFYDNSTTGLYDIIPISDRVNAVRNDDLAVQEPISRDERLDVRENNDKADKQLSLF